MMLFTSLNTVYLSKLNPTAINNQRQGVQIPPPPLHSKPIPLSNPEQLFSSCGFFFFFWICFLSQGVAEFGLPSNSHTPASTC